MKRILLLFCFACLAWAGRAQGLYFPPNIGTTWDTLAPSSLGWCQDSINSLYDYLEERNTKGFVVLKDGKIVLERYFGTFQPDSLWYWASAGKTLTAMVVGIAQQEGHLQLSDTTSNYLGSGWTACPPAKEEKITIWHQLTMTSGLDDGVPDHHCTLDTCLQYLADAGTRWAYHNGPYTLLDGVITGATGQSLNAYTTAKIGSRIGMNGLFFPSGYNNVYVSNIRSMARYGLLMLNKGNWNGTPVLSDTAYFHQMTHSSQNLNQAYGYLTWLNGSATFMAPGIQFQFPGPIFPDAPSDMYAAMGKNGQFINVIPSQNMVVVRAGNAPFSNEVPFLMNDTIMLKISNLTCATAAPAPVEAMAFSLAPNPSLGTFKLSWAQNQAPKQLNLLNLQGQVLKSWEPAVSSTEMTLEIEAFPSGLYFLQIQTADGAVCKRVVLK